jgi:hypothetical protein
MTTDAMFYLNQLRCLVGGRVTGLARTGPTENGFEEEFFGLVIILPDGSSKTLILLSDDEGNGPGSFEIQ